MDELLSLTQGASICGVHLVTLQRAIHRGDLKSLKVAGRRFISKPALEKWIKNQNKLKNK